MANDIYNYSVMTNTGKGFITNEDSRAFWTRSFRGNVWVATDVENQDIGWQDTMVFLKQKQKHRLFQMQ